MPFMRILSPASVVIAATFMGACNRGSGHVDPLPAQAGVRFLSGDNQAIVQHRKADFTVEVIDSSGMRRTGVAVTFSASGLTVDPDRSTATTDGTGVAQFSGYFHDAGNIRLTAASDGTAPAIGSDAVSGSPYTFDGYYVCDGYGADPYFKFEQHVA